MTKLDKPRSFTSSSCRCLIQIQAGGDDFVVLRPCRCILCLKCFVKLVVNRKFGSACCGEKQHGKVDSIYYVERCREGDKMVSKIEVEGHEPSREKDPCRYFERLFEEANLPQATKDKDGEDQLEADDNPRHTWLLSLSYAHITEGYSVPKSLDVLLDREYGPETHQDELKLRLMFGLLHQALLRSHAAIWKETSFPRMTPSEFCNHLMHDDESLLLKLVYALETGEMTLPMQKITKDRTAFSRFMACHIAKEMIQRLMERPGPLQWMMGDVLSINCQCA